MNSNILPALVEIPVWMGDAVFADLAAGLHQYGQGRVLLVADERTFQACGSQVEEAVQDAGLVLAELIFPAQPTLNADEVSIVQVLQALNGQEHLLAAVGSGTITDIVRYAAFQTRLPFISIPTAASVDAYTSFTTSVTFKQVKHSILTKSAEAVYAHLSTLCAAPAHLTASGFSDMVAKYTALADWRLAQLLVGADYHDFIAQQARMVLQECVREVDAVRRRAPAGITALAAGLMTSGHCMVTEKSSRPAAGAEHSLAHFWEIQHQLKHLPTSLHGEKTGVASVLTAGLYENLRRLSLREALWRLDHFHPPDPQAEAARLCTVFGPLAEQLIAGNPSFLGDLCLKMGQIKTNLSTHWNQVQAAASSVPAPGEITTLLESAGSASKPEHIHIEDWEVQQALENAMYVRSRFTILELNRMLDLVSIH